MGIRELLLGVSTYEAPPRGGLDIESRAVRTMRKALGGQISPLPYSQIRWYQRDLESAIHAADTGDLQPAARLAQACHSDGVYSGLLATRTGGLVRLPKKFKGRDDIVLALQAGNDSVRSVFDEMFPPQELARSAADGVELGVFVGELLPVVGRDFPVFVRLDPQYLTYRWSENRWYYRSVMGLLPITPGDGRWILGTPGGRISPWQAGIWTAVGGAFIDKHHARLHAANWESKLANPARVAVSPQGSSEYQKQAWFQAVMGWGINTVFGMTPGYDVKLIESNGRGYESFIETIKRCEREMILAVSGQEVTTDGGAGFSNTDVHRQIQKDLIKATGDFLAYALNTQGIPPWVEKRFGADAVNESAIVEWDVNPPKDRNNEAMAMMAAGTAIKTLKEALAPFGLQPNVKQILAELNISTIDADVKTEVAKLDLAPTDVAVAITVDEVRANKNLAPLGGERGSLMIGEAREKAKIVTAEIAAEAQPEPTAPTAAAPALPAKEPANG